MTAGRLALACILYAAFLFLVAFLAERRAGTRLLRGPLVYTLSLSVYCTAWTFYGAVGYAARSGLEFMTIYLGPTLVFVGWWTLLRRLVAVGRAERTTSIADLVSARYGKSPLLAALVTVLALVGTTPYIALQLQSVTLSFQTLAPADQPGEPGDATLALGVAGGLALFAILFGTRRLDMGGRHDGIVAAIAVEAVVKLVALLAVGGFVTWELLGGPGGALAAVGEAPFRDWTTPPGRWAGLVLVSAAAIVCLPRMFHVLVVENRDAGHLATASWAFPLYMLAMCVFVLPLAAAGLARLPPEADPDLFVLLLPIAEGRDGLAMLAFLGGFSAATSMVIVAAVALATMLSNHLVMPLWLLAQGERRRAVMSGDVRRLALRARRGAIVAVLGLGWLYFRTTGGTEALAATGLVAFAGVAQILPALLLGLYWEGATRLGAALGIAAGFAVWGWTMLLPALAGPALDGLMAAGPWGIAALRPGAPLGFEGDPFLPPVVLSLGLNAVLVCAGSLLAAPSAMERLQASRVIHVLDRAAPPRPRAGSVGADELLLMAQRILGFREAAALFRAQAQLQGRVDGVPETTPDLLEALERRLAGSVGAATAHAMLAGITGEKAVSVAQLMAVADEAVQIVGHSARLEAQSAELARTAAELRAANAKLTALSAQKDAFLGQVSHELRTPMTSVRAFSEILLEPDLSEGDRRRYAGIVLGESRRLTRLLDDLLDLGVLESGRVALRAEATTIGAVLDRAVDAAGSGPEGRRLVLHRDAAAEAVAVVTDPDRLAQVFINVIGNAAKYCDAAAPRLAISVARQGPDVTVALRDNGSGVAPELREAVFEKFTRGAAGADRAGGVGLGLSICREIMARLGGSVRLDAEGEGAAFRVVLPVQPLWAGDGAPVATAPRAGEKVR